MDLPQYVVIRYRTQRTLTNPSLVLSVTAQNVSEANDGGGANAIDETGIIQTNLRPILKSLPSEASLENTPIALPKKGANDHFLKLGIMVAIFLW